MQRQIRDESGGDCPNPACGVFRGVISEQAIAFVQPQNAVATGLHPPHIPSSNCTRSAELKMLLSFLLLNPVNPRYEY